MSQYLFGPVPSRRLGLSLGIDLVPHKVCPLNCVYCECGATTRLTTERKEYVPTAEVLSELRHFLQNNPAPDILTFSGAGEPTLHKDFGFILKSIHQEFPEIPVAVLTNAITLVDSQVRDEMQPAGIVLPSLDAASQETFKKINRPAKGIAVEDVIEGLILFRNDFKGEIWLEILILPGYNDSLKELDSFKKVLPQIKPDKVQLNTLDRPGTVAGLQPAGYAVLMSIRDYLGVENMEIVAKQKITKRDQVGKLLESRIANTISRRPCTVEDLSEMLGISENEAIRAIEILSEQGKIEASKQERGVFYRLKTIQ